MSGAGASSPPRRATTGGRSRSPPAASAGGRSAAPVAYRSWRARRLLEDRMETRAEGLATRVAFELPQRIMWQQLDDFVLVDEDELDRAVLMMIEGTRNLVEPAGAAPLAAALRLKDRLAAQEGGL